ncbi:hypothetical protein BFJ71_g15566 [Fusarium oxysporum]|nr:hypothetical protein BFJ71_g15566 [Fusarium oxysporum]
MKTRTIDAALTIITIPATLIPLYGLPGPFLTDTTLQTRSRLPPTLRFSQIY